MGASHVSPRPGHVLELMLSTSAQPGMAYRLLARLAFIALRLAAFFGVGRAKSWLEMRPKTAIQDLTEATRRLPEGAAWRWIHCASVGEYEQAIPVIEAIKAQDPTAPILLTVFSPSVWGPLQKRRPSWMTEGDAIFALPADLPELVTRWIQALSIESNRPRVKWLGLVKYEIWPEWIAQLTLAQVPVHVFGAHVVAGALPFRWWAGTHRRAWQSLTSVWVQDEASVQRLAQIQVAAQTLGDPRFDRVLAIAEGARRAPELAELRSWIAGRPCLVAGSTWPAEESALAEWWPGPTVALVVAPHEVDRAHIESVASRFEARGAIVQRYSQGAPVAADVLLVDSIGWLSRLYAVADVALVGGGFQKGIHNVLEPAAHGVPTVVGPATHRFREAQEMETRGALRRITRPNQISEAIDFWLLDREQRALAGSCALAYAESGRGAAIEIARALERSSSVEKS